ncbi:Dps family protein [Phaeodactylibacter luteus]|uniref:DNA starvation/stationary phase protection protein n=1 Tax=Phaeodactylibacter luteus TaxID=1564516 RepID=A0A5C6RHX5_9BACT|nr:DNA starvation/stationary phase protection protein [Phaeodactylibacter luteus]TXB61777.1 DNA starvation/stationary phase protection protein [Phaeodactylibacter luteus]
MSLENKQLTHEKVDVNIGIETGQRGQVAQALKQLLADEHILYIKLRNYHWNVTGIHFQQLHAFFEEQYTALAEHIDDIAERIRSIGYFAPGSMEAFRQHARLEETGHFNGNAEQMLKNLLADHEAIIQFLRNDQEMVMEECNDAGTQDFLIALMEVHEKMAWMVRAHLA